MDYKTLTKSEFDDDIVQPIKLEKYSKGVISNKKTKKVVQPKPLKIGEKRNKYDSLALLPVIIGVLVLNTYTGIFSPYKYISNTRDVVDYPVIYKISERKDYDNEFSVDDIKFFEFQGKTKQALEINEDVVGFIQIEGTKIDYPVLFKKHDWYLRRNIYGKNDIAGAIYMENRNEGSWDTPMTLIHGHMMNNGTMFASIKDYQKKDFSESHNIVRTFDGKTVRKYEFVCSWVQTGEEGLEVNFQSQGAFNNYVKELISKSVNVNDKYKDLEDYGKVLVLNTCTYELKDGRTLAMFKEIK